MRKRLTNGDIRARKARLSSILVRIEVDDHAVHVIDTKQLLAAAMQSQNAAVPQVRGLSENGAPGWSRTSGLKIRSLVLYPTELRARERPVLIGRVCLARKWG